MAVMMTADADGEQEEANVVLAEYEALLGQPMAPGQLADAFAAARRDPDAVLEEIRATAMLPTEREAALCAAIRVCMADAELQDGEIATLPRVASALHLDTADVRRLMSVVWREERARAAR